MDEQDQDEEEVRSLLNSFIDVVENNAIFQLADDLSIESDREKEETLLEIARLLNRISASESIKHARLIQERLQAIKTLQALMDDQSTVEKTFERHLSKNPWLINPYWNQTPKTQEEIQVVTQVFNRLYLDDKDEEYRRTFIDICIYVAENRFPIIVELKRNAVTSYSNVSFSRIYEQITSYRRALIQKLGDEDKTIREEDIPAYFIGSEDMGPVGAGYAIAFTDAEMDMLKRSNIILLTYRDLVIHAERAYRDHINVIESRDDTPMF